MNTYTKYEVYVYLKDSDLLVYEDKEQAIEAAKKWSEELKGETIVIDEIVVTPKKIKFQNGEEVED